MKQYEYKMVVIGREPHVSYLNKLGLNGWALVHVFTSGDAILMREIQLDNPVDRKDSDSDGAKIAEMRKK